MKTPLQELQLYIISQMDILKEYPAERIAVKSYKDALDNISSKVNSELLEKERQMVIDAFKSGLEHYPHPFDEPMKGEEYYTKTFGE